MSRKRMRPNDYVRRKRADHALGLSMVLGMILCDDKRKEAKTFAETSKASRLGLPVGPQQDAQQVMDNARLDKMQKEADELLELLLLFGAVEYDKIMTERLYQGGKRGRRQVDPWRWRPTQLQGGIGGGQKLIPFMLTHASSRGFKQFFRVNRQGFWFLHDILVREGVLASPKLRARSDSLCTQEQLGVALARLGQRGYQLEAARSAGWSAEVVKKYTLAVVCGVQTVFENKISLPTQQEAQALVDQMRNDRGMWNAWGALDGKHFSIKYCGKYDPVYFKSYKLGGPGIAVLIIVDSNMKIRWSSKVSPAPRGDAIMWNTAEVKRLFDNNLTPVRHILTRCDGVNHRACILSDTAFALNSTMLKKFTDTEIRRLQSPGDRQAATLFNVIQGSAGKLVEQVWGVLVHRFPILINANGWKGDTWIQDQESLLKCCFILHNICIDMKDTDNDLDMDDAALEAKHQARVDNFVAQNANAQANVPVQNGGIGGNIGGGGAVRLAVARELTQHYVRDGGTFRAI